MLPLVQRNVLPVLDLAAINIRIRLEKRYVRPGLRWFVSSTYMHDTTTSSRTCDSFSPPISQSQDRRESCWERMSIHGSGMRWVRWVHFDSDVRKLMHEHFQSSSNLGILEERNSSKIVRTTNLCFSSLCRARNENKKKLTLRISSGRKST